jgi:sensor histidine kinase regulating citrate/malate metabolism
VLKSPENRSIPSFYVVIILLILITVFSIVEFRLVTKVMTEYNHSLQQAALSKAQIFTHDITSFAEGAARKLERGNHTTDEALQEIVGRDLRITAVYLVGTDGHVIDSTTGGANSPVQHSPAFKRALVGETLVTGGENAKIRVGTPVRKTATQLQSVLLIDFKAGEFFWELTQLFAGENYKVALLDGGHHPVVWPFDPEKSKGFSAWQDKFHDHNLRYRVNTAGIKHSSWQICFFQKDNPFETYRVIIIMGLLFVLCFCIYEFTLYKFMVDLWHTSSINAYFEDINFAVFNHLKEGIVICNQAGKIVFANEAAHRFFANQKRTLKGIDFQEIFGPVPDTVHGENRKTIFKSSGQLLEIARAPIFKEGKLLGSLAVITLDHDQEKISGNILAKLVGVDRDGLVVVDKNHEIILANVMANYYLGSLEKGRHISEVDSRLATAIADNTGSRSLNQVALDLNKVTCEIAAVYDDNGRYVATLVFLRSTADSDPAVGL